MHFLHLHIPISLDMKYDISAGQLLAKTEYQQSGKPDRCRLDCGDDISVDIDEVVMLASE